MAQVVREDHDQLNAVITVTLTPEDYAPLFKQELKKHKAQANMKGFRKGKTPYSVLKKMFGKGVLGEVVNKLIQDNLFEFLEKEELKYLGQPILADGQEELDLDVNAMDEDYVISFAVGLRPEVELKGADKSAEYEQYVVGDIDASVVDENIERMRKRHGSQEQVESDIVENDLVKIAIKELDGEAAKEGGATGEVSILLNEKATDSAKEALFGKNVGDVTSLNIFEAEKDFDEAKVRKYYLQLEENDDRVVGQVYEATVLEITRQSLAEINQDLFDKQFGAGKVNSIEEVRAAFEDDLRRYFKEQTNVVVDKSIQERLMEENIFDLPDTFLKKWLKENNENVTDELIEKDYENFAKNTRWSIISDKISKQHNIEVQEQDLIDHLLGRIRQMYGGMGDDAMLRPIVQNLLKDEKQASQAYEEVLAVKIFNALRGDVTIIEKPKSIDELNTIMTDFYQPAAEQPAENTEDFAETIESEPVAEEATTQG